MPVHLLQNARLLNLQVVDISVKFRTRDTHIAAILPSCSQIHDEALPAFSAFVSLNIDIRDRYKDTHRLMPGIGEYGTMSSLRKVNWVTTQLPAAETIAAFVESFPNLESFALDVEWMHVYGGARNAPRRTDIFVFDYLDTMSPLTFTSKYTSTLRCLLSALQGLRGRGVKQPEILFKTHMDICRKTALGRDVTSTVRAL